MRASLSLRLLLAATVSTLLALLATAIVLNVLFRGYFEERIEDELDSFLVMITGNVGLNADGAVEIAPIPDPRFSQPLSGYAWQIQIGAEAPQLSPSFWDAPLVLTRPAEPGRILYDRLSLGPGSPVSTASWVVVLGQADNETEVFLTVILDRADVEISVAGFFTNSALWLLVLGAFLLVASWVQVRVGLRPLEKIRSEVNRIATATDNRLSDDYPREVLPLVAEVNALLDANDATLDRVRARTGNLAHGLKTPLTVLRGVARTLRNKGDTDLAQSLDTELNNLQHIVERELARSRDSHQSQRRTPVARPLDRLQKALAGQPGAEHIHWDLEVDEGFEAPFDEFDLTELLGNLLENAVKWTEDRIVVRTGQERDFDYIKVEDNGPGIPEHERAAVLERGERLDPNRPGAGLGLTIVRDMAEAHGCLLALERGSMGGLCVQLSWPGRRD